MFRKLAWITFDRGDHHIGTVRREPQRYSAADATLSARAGDQYNHAVQFAHRGASLLSGLMGQTCLIPRDIQLGCVGCVKSIIYRIDVDAQ